VSEVTTTPLSLTIGIDLGDRQSHVCVLDAEGVADAVREPGPHAHRA